MNGYKFQVYEEGASNGIKILPSRKALQSPDEIRDLFRIRRDVAPTAKAHARNAPAPQRRRVRDPLIYRWTKQRFVQVQNQISVDWALLAHALKYLVVGDGVSLHRHRSLESLLILRFLRQRLAAHDGIRDLA